MAVAFRPVAATLLLCASALAGVLAQGEPANWALDRIDQRSLPLDRRFTAGGGGDGVTIYLIDTGVRTSHPEFGQRAEAVGDFFRGSPGSLDADDCARPDGHGTLVASLAAGSTFGVARRSWIRVLRAAGGPTCEGDPSATARAVEWVTKYGQRPAVVNIGFRFEHPELNAAIRRSIGAGFVYTLSAGTAGDVTKYWGQALSDEALVVASTDEHDTALRSDYGPALTLFAPAVSITGAGVRAADGGFTPTRLQSGDSFASPLAAGVAALYLEHHPTAPPSVVRRAILDAASMGVVTNPGSSPNRLLHLTNPRQ